VQLSAPDGPNGGDAVTNEGDAAIFVGGAIFADGIVNPPWNVVGHRILALAAELVIGVPHRDRSVVSTENYDGNHR
jgi:hypothetical protein